LALLEHLDVVDPPVGLVECGGVVLHEGLAASLARTLGGENIASPVAAESEVKDHVHVVEVVSRAGSSQSEIGIWFAPPLRVRVVRCDVLGDVVSGEEEGLDIAASPLQSIDTTLPSVETGSVGSFGTDDSTSLVARFVGGIDVAVEGGLSVGASSPVPGEGGGAGAHCATIAGVKGGLISALLVDTLDDVDLAGVGPVGTHQPPRGPRAAASWHIYEISDEKTTVPGLVGGKTNGLSSSSRGNVGVV